MSLSPSTKPLAFELVVTPRVGASVDLRCAAHFLPHAQ
jgi:hypothetical protein